MSQPVSFQDFSHFAVGKIIKKIECQDGELMIELEGGGAFRFTVRTSSDTFLRFRSYADDPDGELVDF